MAKREYNPFSVPVTSIIDSIGANTIASVIYVQQLLLFTWRVLFSFSATGQNHGLRRRPIVNQIVFSGIDALPSIIILSLAIAISVTTQFILMLESLTSEREVIQVLSKIVAQELAPLLTAIILIGRSGSAITVELGNMRVNKELNSLELLGIDINQFFAMPRVLGVMFSQFALTVFFAGIVMVGGIIFSALLDSLSNYKYLFLLVESFTPVELIVFVIKNFLFGLIIGSTACFHGFRVSNLATEVPQQTQQAIVNSLILVFVFDGVTAMLVWLI